MLHGKSSVLFERIKTKSSTTTPARLEDIPQHHYRTRIGKLWNSPFGILSGEVYFKSRTRKHTHALEMRDVGLAGVKFTELLEDLRSTHTIAVDTEETTFQTHK